MLEDVHDSAERLSAETGLLTQATARAAHPREWRGKTAAASVRPGRAGLFPAVPVRGRPGRLAGL